MYSVFRKIKMAILQLVQDAGAPMLKARDSKTSMALHSLSKNFNVKIGTMFHKTKVYLESWFIVIVKMLIAVSGYQT